MNKIKKEEVLKLAVEQGVLPPFHHPEAKAAIAITKAAYDGGLRIIEFTNRSTNALSVFHYVIESRAKLYPDMVIGVGTIMNVKQAKEFHQAGAQFIVAPTLNFDVGAWCTQEELFWCPGAGTATEIVQAHEWGASLVKLFPAEVLGAVFLKAVLAPCPWLKIMPSGGVTLEKENLHNWFQAGAACVAIGSHLFTKKVMADQQYGELESHIRTLLKTIRELKRGS